MTCNNQLRLGQNAMLRIMLSGLLLQFSNGCVTELECCAPGKLQLGDDQRAEKGSFCTNKPFEQAYKLRIGQKAPMQLNLVDYCTDEVIFTSYFAPTIDKFSLVNFPCTVEPVPCTQQPEGQQEACQTGEAVWSEVGCSNDGKNFFHEVVKNRICNEENYPEDNTKGYKYYPYAEGDSVIPPSKGGCNCDWDLMKAQAVNRTGDNSSMYTTGVPDNFIRRGMSTFYVQVVIGGRTTSANDDPTCQCSSPRDTSKACMCALGTRKVPYIYNNSALPYLTALVSMKNGQLIYKKTYVNFNWEANGIGCVGCPVDYCWGVPKSGVEGLTAWGYMGFDLEMEQRLMCGIRLEPNTEYDNEPYCQFPQNAREIDACSLKVYVAWVGTDGYGRACTSSNEMFSKFTQMGVSNIAVDFYNGFSNIATTVDQRITGRN
mmetsp:Transcript_47686/g.112538  ORF Transcript_47686/g.112538 Transcript_47686/m.112538 type:complete len:430 (-) Transcript_47686:73-1362(-)